MSALGNIFLSPSVPFVAAAWELSLLGELGRLVLTEAEAYLGALVLPGPGGIGQKPPVLAEET